MMDADPRSRAAARPRSVRAASAAAIALAAALAAAPASPSLYGVNAHVPPPALLDEIAAAGVRWVRVDFLWSWIEPAPDRFEWSVYDDLVDAALARGLRVYATISDTPAWATDGPAGRGVPRSAADWYDVCYRAASRYRGRVDHWGMWNEPNARQFWAGSRSEYIATILKPGAAAVHAAGPGARACGPELAHLESASWDGWLRDVLRQGAADLDVVTHHLYPDGASSRSVIDLLARGSSYPWDPPSVKEVLRDAGWLGKPFWLTETGCSSGASASGEQAQAAFVASLSAALFGPARAAAWVHKVFFYEIADDPRFPSAPLGLLGPPPGYRQKPAFAELRRVAAELPADDAEVVRVDFPDWLPPRAAATGVVVVRNTGTTGWSAVAGYRLAVADGAAVLTASRHELPAGETVAPGESVEFRVELTAPAAAISPGSAAVGAWQMIREGKWRFGEVAGAAITIGDGGARRAWVMPFAAPAAGGGGRAWGSDLALHNRAAAPLTVTISFLAEGEDNSRPRTASVDIAAGSTVVLADVLAELLGAHDRGVLRVEAVSAEVAAGAVARVAAAGGGAVSLLPGQGGEAAIPAGGEGYLLRLARSGGGSELRSDLVLLNPSAAVGSVDVDVLDDGGAVAGSMAYALGPFAVRVVDDALGAAGIAAATRAWARVRPSPDGAGVHAWALLHGGGDPRIVTATVASDEPAILAPLQGGSRLRGGAWRTDVQLVNPDAEPALVVIELLAPAGRAPHVSEVEVEIAGGAQVAIDDALAALFSFRGNGALLVTPRSGRVAAAAGTALARAPSRSGRAIAPIPLGRAVGDGGECRLFPVARGRSADGARTHAGIVNLTDATLAIQAQVLDAAGRSLRTFPLYLSAREYRQSADILQVVPSLDGAAYVIVLRPLTPGGRFVAHGTVVLGATGGGSIHVPCT